MNHNSPTNGRNWEGTSVYSIGDPPDMPHAPYTPQPFVFTPTPMDANEERTAFKALSEQIRELADTLPGSKKVRKLLKRLVALEKRVAELEQEKDRA